MQAGATTSKSGGGGAGGPIKTLKRTFSSNTPVIPNTSSNNDNMYTTMNKKHKNNKAVSLPASAYDIDFEDDDSWGDDIELTDASTSGASVSTIPTPPKAGVANGTNGARIPSKLSKSSTLTSASSLLLSGSSTVKSNTPQSPPRAPAPLSKTHQTASAAISNYNNNAKSTSSALPMASQWQSGFNMPSLPKAPTNILPASLTGVSALDQHAYEAHMADQETEQHKNLPSAILKAPFSKKIDKSQHTLSQFVKREPSADADTSTSSTKSSSSSSKRSAPWDLASSTSSKSAKTTISKSTSASSVASTSKGKGKVNIGTLNVQQQIVLSPEQQKVLKTVVEGGKNVFFTGSAGTGKSILLREIIKSLRKKYASRGADRVAITASTGMAAANIGGTTIHSFAGIGLGQGTAEHLVDFVKKNRKAPGRWLRTEVLIIDEVSMLDGDLFDKLAHIATRFRRKPDKPFGGIQLIMTGDFFQLPPVTKGSVPRFAFEAKSWENCIDMTVNLTKVFRQRDTEFIDMLNEMRFGRLSDASIGKFRKLKRQPQYNDGIEPTELFPLRQQVDDANRARLAALPGEEHHFFAMDDGEEAPDRLQKTLENVMAPKQLVLKLNAQVMLLKNMENGLVNGSVGKVVAFKSLEETLEEDDDVEGSNSLFGQDAEKLRALAMKKEKDAGKDGEAVKKAKNPAMVEKAPVVEWKMPDGSRMRMRMSRDEFKVDDIGDKVKARRKQFPMICAWAMSIHKSQGQTLERVKCDLGKIFEKGQAYVALSRATSLDGLQVLNFDPTKVMAHPKVVTWTKTLTTLDT